MRSVRQQRWMRVATLTGIAVLTTSVMSRPIATAVQVPAGGNAIGVRPPVIPVPALPYRVIKPRVHAAAPVARASLPRPGTSWPTARNTSVVLSRSGGALRSAWTLLPGMPVSVQSSGPGGPSSGPGSVVTTHLDIRVLGPDAASKVGLTGVLLQITRLDAGTDALALRWDYSRFANASGAQFGQRLRLVTLPSCAVMTPALKECQVQNPIASTNDAVGQVLTAELTTRAVMPAASSGRSQLPDATLPAGAGSAVVLAAAADSSGPGGDFTTTSLAPSGSWAQSGSTGGFTYSYPIATPDPAVGTEVTPHVALAYDSASVDGRIASTNNQTSWVGQGWDYSPGFVERTYQACTDQSITGAQPSGDLCWAGPIFTYSLNGSSNAIVRDDASGGYRLQSDDGSRVELISPDTGGYQNEYWRITTPNGVQYFFGRSTLPGGSLTNSTWTVPVCGNSTTSCSADSHGMISPFADQAWRWNLDYVLDPHGNAAAYYYTPETGWYGEANATTRTAYTRGGYLSRIDYGMHEISGTTTTLSSPGDRITIGVSERCISGCTTFDLAHFPDTPTDQDCSTTTTACNVHSPTFWTRKRLTAIATYWNNAGTYTRVDGYSFGQSFPSTGDPELELDSITRTGYQGGASGTTLPLPPVTFSYAILDNRIAGLNALPAMAMWRLKTIITETGEQISASYDGANRVQSQCTSSTIPTDAANNTAECFPVKWTKPYTSTEILDWFHTHVVTEVDLTDKNATAATQVRPTTYTYLGGAAWHFEDNEVTRPKNRTYGQRRGYQLVQTRTGDPTNTVDNYNSSSPISDKYTLSTTTYLRGMGASATDTFGTTITDSNEFAGAALEVQQFNGDTTTEVSASVTTPWIKATTATRARTGLPDLTATMMRTKSALIYTDLATGGTRWRKQFYSYDSIGRLAHRTSSGTAVSTLCTTTHYADNTSSWIRDRVSEVITSAQTCPATDTGLANILSRQQTYFDGSGTLNALPGDGDPTRTQMLTSGTDWAVTDASYDAFGRPTSTTVNADTGDVRSTRTNYTPNDGSPVTAVAVTNAKNQVATTTIDPGRGSILARVDVAGHRTDATYDPLGRVTAVWRPGQSISAGDPATSTASYMYGPNAALAVTTNTLVDPGTIAQGYITSVSIYDAFGQLRQTQSDAVGGGRNITDAYSDSHGWVVQTNNRWHTTGAPSAGPITPSSPPPSSAQASIDSSTQSVYDGAGRVVRSTDFRGITATWSTLTTYSGDSVTVDPPTGGVETTTRTDARGNTSEFDQWTSLPTIAGNVVSGGTARATTYGYDALDRRTTITTAAGTSLAATFTTSYDLAGRVVQITDPDTGTTTNVYNDASELIHTQDASGTDLAYGYDALGRKTGEYAGTDTGGTKLASWLYDTLQAGQRTSSTAYTSTGTYTEAATGYDAAGNLLGSRLTMSAPDTGFATTYTSSQTWTRTHLPAYFTPAAGGNLPTESVHAYYDKFGHPAALDSDVATYVSDTIYTTYGEPSQYTLDGNNQTSWLSYTIDSQTGRVTDTDFSAKSAAAPKIDHTSYSYDAVGNIIRSIDTEGYGTGAPVETQCNTFDRLDQLTQSWSSATTTCTDPTQAGSNAGVGGPQPYWLTWALDAGGGRKQQVQHATPGSGASDNTTDYINGAATAANGKSHALQSLSSTSGDTATYTYNADGTTKTVNRNGTPKTLTYTPEGHTRAIATSAGTVTYVYDADGNQLLRRDPGKTTLYLPTEELTFTTAAGTTGVRYYTHNGQVVAMRDQQGNPTYLGGDPRGTNQIALPTTISGTGPASRRNFDPYGNPLGGSTGLWPVADTHTFLNQPTDPTTGLSDLGARKYDSTTGRFLTVDPVLDTNDPQQLNGYAYGNNNPINNADPTGLAPACIIQGACEGTQSSTGGWQITGAVPDGRVNPGCQDHCGGTASGGAGNTRPRWSSDPHSAITFATPEAYVSYQMKQQFHCTVGTMISTCNMGSPELVQTDSNFAKEWFTAWAYDDPTVVKAYLASHGENSRILLVTFVLMLVGGYAGARDPAVGETTPLAAEANANRVAADTAGEGADIGATTAHGAERVAGAGATRGGVLSPDQILEVRGTGAVWSQADGATVRVFQNQAGRFNVVVDGDRGLITTFSNLSQKSFDRLANNYGWTP